MQPLIAYRLESKTVTNYLRVPEEVKGKLEWVYGIRCADTQHALQYAVGRQAADSTGQRDSYQKQTQLINEEVVYFIAAVVVLLNPHIGKQRYYVGHPHEVISCCVSNLDGSMIATGELCPDNPEVHVWNCQTLECKAVLKGIHSRGVHLIAFTRDDKRLVTCGLN
jgi:WD40 repeat protein